MQINNLFVLDDDTITTHLISEILKEIPAVKSFHIENNGWEALEYLQGISDKQLFPDVLFIDLKMPLMDGFEFIEHYEQQFWQRFSSSRLMVLTSSVSEKDRLKALQYKSVNRFIHKPITPELIAQIAQSNSALI